MSTAVIVFTFFWLPPSFQPAPSSSFVLRCFVFAGFLADDHCSSSFSLLRRMPLFIIFEPKIALSARFVPSKFRRFFIFSYAPLRLLLSAFADSRLAVPIDE